ncbi:MAG: hypothetical protein JNJ45_05495 [Chthonomonas sp.]|nr:hypothetical protein [Chthonomonas sp.]
MIGCLILLAIAFVCLVAWVVNELSTAPLNPGEWTADNREQEDIPDFLRERGKK